MEDIKTEKHKVITMEIKLLNMGGNANWKNRNFYQPFEDMKSGPLLKTCQITKCQQQPLFTQFQVKLILKLGTLSKWERTKII